MTFTKEQLITRINQVAAINNYRISRDPDADGLAMDNELFAIALASLEAEPVGTFRKGPCGYSPSFHEDAVPLYTTPPAPVAVPDDVMAAMQKVARIRLDLNDFDGDKRGILDCLGDAEEALIEVVNRRAAMLQGAENAESPTTMKAAPALDSSPKISESPSGNSPVIPDGWVACSERMPEDGQEVITHNIFGYRYVSFFDEHSGLFFDRPDGNQMNCIEHILVSHWRPAPAAPQQEA